MCKHSVAFSNRCLILQDGEQKHPLVCLRFKSTDEVHASSAATFNDSQLEF